MAVIAACEQTAEVNGVGTILEGNIFNHDCEGL